MKGGGIRVCLILLALAACQDSVPEQPLLPVAAGAVVAPVPLAQATTEPGQLFPVYLATTARGCRYTTEIDPPILDDFVKDWYSTHLMAADERPLTELAAAAPQQLHIRLIWLRAFDAPIIVRIHESQNGRARIEGIRLSGAGGYEPGEIAERVSRDLSTPEYQSIRTLMTSGKLISEPAANCDFGHDGAQWILELVADSQYSFYERWSPDDGPVRELALQMLALTGFDLDPIY